MGHRRGYRSAEAASKVQTGETTTGHLAAPSLRTLMKDARGPHSLAESWHSRLLEPIRHSPRRSNRYSSTLWSSRGGRNRWPHGGRSGAGSSVREDGVAMRAHTPPQAGSLNASPLVSTAQAMRAFFAAMATTAFHQ